MSRFSVFHSFDYSIKKISQRMPGSVGSCQGNQTKSMPNHQKATLKDRLGQIAKTRWLVMPQTEPTEFVELAVGIGPD
jgi:hypothetical protein